MPVVALIALHVVRWVKCRTKCLGCIVVKRLNHVLYLVNFWSIFLLTTYFFIWIWQCVLLIVTVYALVLQFLNFRISYLLYVCLNIYLIRALC